MRLRERWAYRPPTPQERARVEAMVHRHFVADLSAEDLAAYMMPRAPLPTTHRLPNLDEQERRMK